jgi:hypothetical protein
MLEIQFDLPDIGEKGKYLVTEAVVKGEAKLFEKKGSDKKSA